MIILLPTMGKCIEFSTHQPSMILECKERTQGVTSLLYRCPKYNSDIIVLKQKLSFLVFVFLVKLISNILITQ